MRRLTSILAATLVATFGLAGPSLAADKIGIVLMHGKSATSLPKSPMGQLSAKLKEAGFLVATPEMPWSKGRYLDKDYEESMIEVDAALNALKAQGATKLVIGGHSVGANAALGYGARREGLAGVMALAPGHVPELKGYQKSIGNDWRRAKKMVDAGQGNSVDTFKDSDQGKKFDVKAEARVYLSWFAPDGPAVMPKNAAKIEPGTPLLWVIGKKDTMFKRGEKYAFSRAPQADKSAYVVVDAGHYDAPVKASKQIVDWLNGL